MDQGDINSLFLLASSEPLSEEKAPGSSSKYDRQQATQQQQQQQQNILLQTKATLASPEQSNLKEKAKESFIYEAIDNLKSPPTKTEALPSTSASRSKASAGMMPSSASGSGIKPGRQSRKQQQQQSSNVII
jgi:hypothetical protein